MTDENPPTSIQVAIIDDHQVLAEALRQVIQSQPDLKVIATAGSCAAGLNMLGSICPDVLLLDVVLPDGDGIQLIPQIKVACPEVNILVLTSLADHATLMRAMEGGATGFVSKSSGLSELHQSIRQAARGEITAPTSLLLGLLSHSAQKKEAAPAGHEPLTAREIEILRLLAEGLSSGGIAERLVISPMTVRTHIRNLMQKLDVRSRLEAVTYAMRYGLIDPPL